MNYYKYTNENVSINLCYIYIYSKYNFVQVLIKVF